MPLLASPPVHRHVAANVASLRGRRGALKLACLALIAACGGSAPATSGGSTSGGSSSTSGGSSSTSGGSTSTTSNACTVTLSGAVTGTYSCTATGAWASSTNMSAIALTPSTQTPYTISVAVGWPGQMNVGTFKNTDVGAKSGISLVGASTHQAWVAVAGGSQDQGSYALNLTSIGTAFTSTDGTGYTGVHGTLSATLPAVAATGASGNVALTASF